MTQQIINDGTNPNDGSGDTLRNAAIKINSNFTEVYGIAQYAANTANVSFTGETQANIIAMAAYSAQNTTGVYANSAYVQANAATLFASSAGTYANAAYAYANTALINTASMIVSANLTVPGAFTFNSLEIVNPNFINITSTTSYQLSNTITDNILNATNTGYTATLNMPHNPVNGQTIRFATSGNTVTLALGTGNAQPTFAGSATAGTRYRYVYISANNVWFRL